ncbi:MAG: right-handed parallel beta-helix repeat-containing protein [Polyangiaceae bacterium]
MPGFQGSLKHALVALVLAAAPSAALAEGFVDSVTCDAGMKGWAAAPGDKDTAVDVTFTFDAEASDPGAVLHPYVAALPRQDLCAAHGCDHGFEVTLPLSLFDGLEHTVHAYGAEAGTGPGPELSMSPMKFTCPLVLPSGARRKLAGDAAMSAWRFSTFWDEISVSDGIVASYAEGAPLPATPEVVHTLEAPGDVFLIDATKAKAKAKRAFASASALAAWDFAAAFAKEVPDAELSAIPAAAAMRARPFVLRGPDGSLYLVDDDPKVSSPSPSGATSSGQGGGAADDGADAGGSCGCAVVGASSSGAGIAVVCAALAGVALARTRRRRGFVLAAGSLALLACDTKQPGARVAQTSASAVPTPSTSASGPVPTGWDASADPGRDVPCVKGKGNDYEVGPGAKLESLIDVPWERLGPGDTVRVHVKPGGYHEKILISQSGTADAPLRICGIPGPGGELPVIDGADAKTRPSASIDFTYAPQQDRGLVIVSIDTHDTWGFKPSHLILENLEMKHAHPDYSFTGSAGDARTYLDNAAGLYIERGEDIVVRNCVIDDNANGFFLASGGDEATQSRRVTFERNYVYGNGTTGAKFDRHHNIYSEAIGMIYQYNRVGALRAGAGGSALKDRSAGTIVRYNWIEGGSRSLDLVEAEESWQNEKSVPEHNDAWVYGNVILAGPEGASNVVHFGGDNGFEDTYRNGTLYFYSNTVVIRADQSKRWRTALFELSTNRQTVDARNNVVFVTSDTEGAEATNFTLLNQFGTGNFANNLMSASADFSDGVEVKGKCNGSDKITRLGKGADPFKAARGAALDLHLKDGTPGPVSELPTGALPLDHEYVPHQKGKTRVPKALGAFD